MQQIHRWQRQQHQLRLTPPSWGQRSLCHPHRNQQQQGRRPPPRKLWPGHPRGPPRQQETPRRFQRRTKQFRDSASTRPLLHLQGSLCKHRHSPPRPAGPGRWLSLSHRCPTAGAPPLPHALPRDMQRYMFISTRRLPPTASSSRISRRCAPMANNILYCSMRLRVIRLQTRQHARRACTGHRCDRWGASSIFVTSFDFSDSARDSFACTLFAFISNVSDLASIFLFYRLDKGLRP